MAKYTITLGELLDKGYSVGLDHYPIFDERYRPVLNQKILNHYRFYEIGSETPDKFRYYLNIQMDEIMPYYNQLYRSELIQFDPLATDYFEAFTGYGRTEDRTQDQAASFLSGEGSRETFGSNRDTLGSKDTHATDSRQTLNEDIGEYLEDNGSQTKTIDWQKGTLEETVDEKGNYTKEGGDNQNGDETTSLTKEQTDHGERTSSSLSAKGTHKTNLYSDTPQGNLAGPINPEYLPNRQTESGGVEVYIPDTAFTYATNLTDDMAAENETTTTTETVDNTSDITENGSKDWKSQKTWDESGNDTRNTQTDRTTQEDKTQDVDFAEQKKRNTTENGKVDDSGIQTYHEDYKDNVKEDQVRHTDRSRRDSSASSQLSNTKERRDTQEQQKGRRGFIPSDLLKSFRESFLNIDLRIINELADNFMEVF